MDSMTKREHACMWFECVQLGLLGHDSTWFGACTVGIIEHIARLLQQERALKLVRVGQFSTRFFFADSV